MENKNANDIEYSYLFWATQFEKNMVEKVGIISPSGEKAKHRNSFKPPSSKGPPAPFALHLEAV